jgi:hypothetical protein
MCVCPPPTEKPTSAAQTDDKYPLHPALRENTMEVVEAFMKAGEKKERTIIFSGDFHSFFESQICRVTRDGKRNCVDSVITSGITRGSEGLTSPHLCLTFMTDFGVLSPQRIVQASTGSVWTEQGYDIAFPLNNYAALETSRNGSVALGRYLRVPSAKEEFLLTLWFRHGSTSVPILLGFIVLLALALIGGLLFALQRVLCSLYALATNRGRVAPVAPAPPAPAADAKKTQ